MKIAIGYSTYNKPHLTRQSLPAIYGGNYDVFWADGSTDSEALKFLDEYQDVHEQYGNVKGGSGAAIVFLLTKMLQSPVRYSHVGLVEADVVLGKGWFEPTMALFEKAMDDGLPVGAVTARVYEDRILVQRNGYAVLHNTGAGMIIFTRECAELVLNQYRTQKTAENRAIFSQLAGVDIARYWAFRGSDHWLVADWRWDALLASKGWATVGLTPSPVEMAGQNPPLSEQGLVLSTGPLAEFDIPEVFKAYCERLNALGKGEMVMPDSKFYVEPGGFITFFPHQIEAVGGWYDGEWSLKDSMGFGPFAWKAREVGAKVSMIVFGPCELFVGGGPKGGGVRIVDTYTGYDISPQVQPEGPEGAVLTISVPQTVGYRIVTVEALSEDLTFYGVRTRDPQPLNPHVTFNYDKLPPT